MSEARGGHTAEEEEEHRRGRHIVLEAVQASDGHMAMVAVEELRSAEAGAVGRMAVGEPEQEGNGLGVAAADNILLAAAGDIGHGDYGTEEGIVLRAAAGEDIGHSLAVVVVVAVAAAALSKGKISTGLWLVYTRRRRRRRRHRHHRR